MTLKELKAMRLHETVYINESMINVTKVPGGWVYRFYSHELRDEYGNSESVNHSPVFIPNNKNV